MAAIRLLATGITAMTQPGPTMCDAAGVHDRLIYLTRRRALVVFLLAGLVAFTAFAVGCCKSSEPGGQHLIRLADNVVIAFVGNDANSSPVLVIPASRKTVEIRPLGAQGNYRPTCLYIHHQGIVNASRGGEWLEYDLRTGAFRRTRRICGVYVGSITWLHVLPGGKVTVYLTKTGDLMVCLPTPKLRRLIGRVADVCATEEGRLGVLDVNGSLRLVNAVSGSQNVIYAFSPGTGIHQFAFLSGRAIIFEGSSVYKIVGRSRVRVATLPPGCSPVGICWVQPDVAVVTCLQGKYTRFVAVSMRDGSASVLFSVMGAVSEPIAARLDRRVLPSLQTQPQGTVIW